VPIQLAQCRFPRLTTSDDKILIYFGGIKYTEAFLSNSTRKLLWFEITETPIAVKEKIYYWLLPLSLLRRNDGCEQFAEDSVAAAI